jgi:hypothetical protein
METQRSKNFNEFYRSTGEHLVTFAHQERFEKVLYHVNSRILKCKMKNVITMLYQTLQTKKWKHEIHNLISCHIPMLKCSMFIFNHVGHAIFHFKMFMTIFKQLTKSRYMLNTPHILYYVVWFDCSDIWN